MIITRNSVIITVMLACNSTPVRSISCRVVICQILCFQVQVKSLDGTRIGIDLKGTATLADLKGLLHKNLGLPRSDQRFALVGQILDDTRYGWKKKGF